MDTGANVVVMTREAAKKARLHVREIDQEIKGFGGATTALGYIGTVHLRVLPFWIDPDTDALCQEFLTLTFREVYVTDFLAGVDMLAGRQAMEEAHPFLYKLLVDRMDRNPCEFADSVPDDEERFDAEVIECLDEIVDRYGLPLVVQTDGGPNMSAAVTKEHVEGQGAIKYVTTPRRANSNGLVEVTTRLVKTALKCHIGGGDKRKFHTCLKRVKRDLNNRVHTIKGKSPFEIMFGFPQRTELLAKLDGLALTGHPRSIAYERALEAVHMQMEATVEEAKRRTRNEHVQRKRWYDSQIREHRIFKVGDYALLMNRPVPKQLEGYFSRAVYKITEVLHGDTYQVEQIATKATTRAHASHLKAYDMTRSSEEKEIALAFKESEGMIEKVVKHSTAGSKTMWFSVQYVGHDKPTWLSARELKSAPAFVTYCDEHHLDIPSLIKEEKKEEERKAKRKADAAK